MIDDEDVSPEQKYDKSKFAKFNAEVQPLDSSFTSSSNLLNIDTQPKELDHLSSFDCSSNYTMSEESLVNDKENKERLSILTYL